MMKAHQQQNGFALLLTLVIVSVVLAIGLTLLDITLKQLTISGTNRDSEIAFHAAYAGAECAQYWRLQDLTDYTPPFTWCLGTASGGEQPHPEGNTDIHFSQYEIDWSEGGTGRCTEIDLYIFDDTDGNGVTYNIPEYDADTVEECSSGTACTFILSRGYNRGCSDIDSLQTIQREVLLEF